jgi:hypothetical protein
MIRKALRRLSVLVNQRIGKANDSFNVLPKTSKRLMVIAFGICTTGISALLIIQALRDQESQIDFKPETIAMPYDIFKKEETAVSDTQLIPVGKMKGEIEGEFESFYVAVDNKGSIFINREIESIEVKRSKKIKLQEHETAFTKIYPQKEVLYGITGIGYSIYDNVFLGLGWRQGYCCRRDR